MQDPNIPTGVYEQIINRLFNLKLSRMDAERFYIGKKQITSENGVTAPELHELLEGKRETLFKIPMKVTRNEL